MLSGEKSQKPVPNSREVGLIYDFQREGIGDDIKKIKEDLEQRWNWIWNEDLEAELTNAMEIFKEETARLG